MTNTQLNIIQAGIGTAMPKRARPHQQDAIRAVAEAFQAGADRCQVVMACGTGKTLVAQRVSEHEGIASDGLTVVACPSISLLAQTLAAWRVDSKRSFTRLAVCSDPSVEAAVAGPDEPADSLASLAAATDGALVTTSTTDIKCWLDENKGRNVVFSTHASLGRVAEALASLDRSADLLVVDEAHNVAGVVKPGSEAAELKLGRLATKSFPARRRLFMTATPKVVRPGDGEGDETEIVSMDNDPDGPFGAVVYRLTFAQAVELGLLVDFKVVVQVALTDEVMKRLRSACTAKVGNVHVTPAELARHYAVHQAAENHGLHRLLSFHNTVRGAMTFSERACAIAPELASESVTVNEWLCGEHSAAERKAVLDRLAVLEATDRMVVSSARVLTEGVDVPAVDGVVFVDPRSSVIDIAQAVGRAMRRHTDPVHGEKKTGVVVVPVVVPFGADPEEYLSTSDWRTALKVLDALKAVDDRLSALLVQRRRAIGRGQLVTDEASNDGPAGPVAGTDRDGSPGVDSAEETDGAPTESPIEGPAGELGSRLGADVPQTSDRGEKPLEEQIVIDGVPDEWLDDIRLHLVRKCTSSFDEWLGHLEAYKAEHGDCRVPQGHISPDGFPLGTWVSDRRRDYKDGRLSAERIAELEASGFAWDAFDRKWLIGFTALEVYKAEYGDCRVPQGHISPDGFLLGAWVAHRRRDRKAGRLSAERTAELEALGFAWDVLDEDWRVGLAALEAYKTEYGDCLVPQRHVFPDRFLLGAWVAARRRDRKAGRLSAERIAILDALSFVWDVLDENWRAGLTALEAYKAAASNGDCLVPQGHVSSDGFPLGKWVSHRREEYKAGRLSAERIAELEALGFAWEVRPR